MTAAIEVSGLVKRFGRVTALDGLDLRVEPGQVAGFLGPNGAGKSTTLRILLGLYRADAGTARVLGGDPWRDAVPLHRRLAYVPGDVTLWPNLTGGQALDVLASLHGRVDRRRRDELVERFDLDPTKKGCSYSKGNRQKVALIAAFQADAELLVLDEPTSGLDPLMEEVFTDCVREARLRGASVLLSSHIFAEVERLCDTVTIVRAGRTVEAGTLDELRHLHRTTVSAEVEASDADLARLEHAADLERTGDRITFSVSDDDLPSTLATLAAMHPRSLVSTPPTLEELFLRHYGTRLEPEAVS